MDYIATWRGRRVDELTREELIQALNYAAEELHRERERSQHESTMLRMMRDSTT